MAVDSEDERFFTQFRRIDELVAAWSKNVPLKDLEASELGEKGFSIRVGDFDAKLDSFGFSAIPSSSGWDPLVVLGQSEMDFSIELDVSGLSEKVVSVVCDSDKAVVVKVAGEANREKRIAFSHPIVASSLRWSVQGEKLVAQVSKRPLDANEKFVPL